MQNIFSAVINPIKAKVNILKLQIRIQQYTVVYFHGWTKMTLKIKTAYVSIVGSEFRKILWQLYAELHREA